MVEGEGTGAGVAGPRGVHAATLYCEVCGSETPHRILRLDPTVRRVVSGTARCRTCRSTHAFQTPVERRHPLSVILSDGPRSARTILEVPSGVTLVVGERMPERSPAARIHKIDRPDGRSVRSARSEEAATVWLTPDVGAVVKVSLIEGRRTGSARLTLSPDVVVAVGGPLQVDGRTWHISALRANGRTWRHPDDAFAARQVERIYARRNERPPAGRSDWRRSRGTPASPASSTSRSARSRSGPGDRT